MIGNNVIRLKETESTNRYASELLRNKAVVEEGTVIIADNQSAGKGTSASHWESEKEKNLTLSIVLYPKFLSVEKQFMINKFVSLGVYEMISKLVEAKGKVTIKWPNDIYVNDKKISGTLIENAIIGNSFQYFILGIGINLNQEVFLSDAPNPTSLKNITGKKYDMQECLSFLCSSLDRRYLQLKNFEDKMLDDDYLSALYRMNELASYIHKGQTIHARIKGITEQGKLILEKDSGQILECNFKEVEFVV